MSYPNFLIKRNIILKFKIFFKESLEKKNFDLNC